MRGWILTIAVFMAFPMALAGKTLKPGHKFPSFKLENLKGKGEMPSSKLKGKIVLVDFWASWCEPCKRALPTYSEIFKKYSSKGFIVVGINVDESPQDGLDFVRENPVEIPLLYDSGKKLVERAGVKTMPTSFLLDRSGRVLMVHEGFRGGDEAKLEDQIRKALEKK